MADEVKQSRIIMYIHLHINFQIAGTNGQYQVPEYTIRGECTTMDLVRRVAENQLFVFSLGVPAGM